MNDAEQSPRGAQKRRLGWQIALAGMTGLAVAVGIGRFAFTPILPMMQSDSGLSVVEGGWLASANYLGYLVGALWALLQPVRSSTAIRSALLIIAITTMAMAWVEGALAWLVLRAVAGVASAWGLIHITSWCGEQLARLEKPLLGGVVFAGVGVGIMVAGTLCLALIANDVGSAGAWLVLGGIGLGIAALTWPILGRHQTSQPKPQVNPRQRGRLWTRNAICLVLCYGASGAGYIIPATFLPVMAKQQIEDPLLFAWAWPVFGFAAVCSTLLAAPLARAFGNRRIWMFGALIMALGVVAPLVVPGLMGIIIAALFVGGTFMVTTMAGIQQARAVGGEYAAPLVAAFTAAFAAGQVLGPILVSSLVGHFDSIALSLVVASAVLIASVLLLWTATEQETS